MDANSKQRGVGFMKNKLGMSFYNTKPPQSMHHGGGGGGAAMVNKSTTSPSTMKKVPSFSKLAGFFGGSDGYVHGPNGGGGDAKVDLKASNYISSFKQRLILEEMNYATNERVEMFRNG